MGSSLLYFPPQLRRNPVRISRNNLPAGSRNLRGNAGPRIDMVIVKIDSQKNSILKKFDFLAVKIIDSLETASDLIEIERSYLISRLGDSLRN